MDPQLTAAARALAAGDALEALNRVALRDDAPALAMRGTAMAQLGDLDRARALLGHAARAFGAGQPVSRARCLLAEAEIAFVSRDLGWSESALEQARSVLQAAGDGANAAHARHLQVRRLLLQGRLDEAEAALAAVDPSALPPALRAGHELIAAGIAMRRIRAAEARAALDRAAEAARASGIVPLVAEVESAAAQLAVPVARVVGEGDDRPVRLDEVEALLASGALVVDGCRRVVRTAETVIPLASRPVLFALARALGEAWPGDAARALLIARAFRGREADESHRARLRVEIGRLRTELAPLADVAATEAGFRLTPRDGRRLVVLAPPLEHRHADVLALLADGEAWSSTALALALGASQRTVQRALEDLASDGRARAHGRGRARRWTAPTPAGFPTTLLLPALPSGG